MKKLYVFFAYFGEQDLYQYPIAKRYYEEEYLQQGKSPEDGIARVMYAWTTNKTLKRLFMMERSRSVYRYKPIVIKMTQDRLEAFEKQYGGRELSLRGIDKYKLSKVSGIGNILGTEDEFSYVEYDFIDDEYAQEKFHLFSELPPAEIFNKTVRKALEILRYPIQTFADYEDPYWMWNNYEIDFNEYALYIHFFSNLYRKNAEIWRDDN